jgi:hypothetical protein
MNTGFVQGVPLLLEEPLCCNVDGTFFRCDGSAFTKEC